MPTKIIPPLALLVALAACGGGAEEESASGEAIGAAEVAARAGKVQEMRPGQYRSATEILALEIPGLPENMREQMITATREGLTQASTFCLTEAEAEAGPRQMVENLARSECTMSRFETSSDTVEAVMQCAGGQGISGTVRMEGEIAAESSTMLLDIDQDAPGVGTMQMRVRVNSERVGDCP